MIVESTTSVRGGLFRNVVQDKWGDRLMNWVRLREKATNTSIFFANTHGPLDQCGGDAGSKAASNYQGAIDKHKQPEDKVVFTGDFNCGSMDETMMTLGQGLFNAATDQSFNGADHVLVSPGVNLCGYSSTGGFPSDHQFLKMHLSLDNGTSNSVPEPALPVAAPVPLLTSASETHSADDSSVRGLPSSVLEAALLDFSNDWPQCRSQTP